MSDWIEWKGAQQGPMVEVLLRDGATGTAPFVVWDWTHKNASVDTIGYRPIFDGAGIIAALPESVVSVKPGYESLAAVLQKAHDQAAVGKGKERHANGLPFENQPMSVINRQLGSIHGFIYQAQKKSLEATRLPKERAVAELLGAINYLAGAVIALEAQP